MINETTNRNGFETSEPWEASGRLPATPPRDELEALHAKIDALTETVGRIDRRREELEELVEDLMPAVNGAMVLLRDRLDLLDRSGAWANGRGALAAAETALTALDPHDLEALAESTPELLRTLRVSTAPEITGLADRLAESLAEARHGPAPSLWQLGRSARSPRVRRGMGVALTLLRALGEGSRGASVPPPPRRRVARGPGNTTGASCQTPVGVATPSPVAGSISAADGSNWELDADGFLADSTTWSRDFGEAVAVQEGLALTDVHWTVLDFVRQDGAGAGSAPGVRRIVAETGIAQKELYRLFPGGPARLAARIAGLKKPKSCV